MFVYTNIIDYHYNLLNGQYTCIEAVVYYIQKIKENQKLNAFVEIFEDESLELALKLDNERRLGGKIGKLHGVVISIKDVISYKRHDLSASSKILNNFTATYDATVVSKLINEEP